MPSKLEKLRIKRTKTYYKIVGNMRLKQKEQRTTAKGYDGSTPSSGFTL